jgi:tRNA threonylcarbamoyladenosine biosynthesis protein TsaE
MPTYHSNSPEKTIEIAQDFAKTLKGGEFIALIGDLGAGKTQFVKGLAKGLGIKKVITSPTFVLLKRYGFALPTKPDRELTLNHIDLYRIDNEIEALGIGLDDLLSEDQITVIEWPQRMQSIFPKNLITIELKYVDENQREIIIY